MSANKNLPSLDHSIVQELRDLETETQDTGLLASLVETFAQDASTRLTTVHRALANRDLEQIRVEGHTLKSSSANLGAVKLSSLCKDLESAGHARSLPDALRLVPEIDRELEVVVGELRNEARKKAA